MSGAKNKLLASEVRIELAEDEGKAASISVDQGTTYVVIHNGPGSKAEGFGLDNEDAVAIAHAILNLNREVSDA